MALTHSPKIPTSALVLSLDSANEKSYSGTGSVWGNLVDSFNNATLLNSPSFSENSFNFDASGKRATISSPLSNTNITASVWYQRDESSSSGSWRTILATTSTNIHHLISQQTSRNLGVWDGSFRDFGYLPPVDGMFHNYTVLYNSGLSASLYVDGVFISTVSTSLDLAVSPIGSIGNWSGGGYWSGKITSATFYYRLLSEAEIRSIYLFTKSRFGL
jgi:hypothetical protein